MRSYLGKPLTPIEAKRTSCLNLEGGEAVETPIFKSIRSSTRYGTMIQLLEAVINNSTGLPLGTFSFSTFSIV